MEETGFHSQKKGKEGWAGPVLSPTTKALEMDSDSLLNCTWDQQVKLHYCRTDAAMYSCTAGRVRLCCQHWISVVCQVTLPLNNHRDGHRLVQVIPGFWSTGFAPLPPPIWWHNFLGTYTMMQTKKLIWPKNNFFHWATSSVTSVHWPATAPDKQLCSGQEVARTNGLRWLLPRSWVQDHSLKLGFIKNSNGKECETHKNF